MKGYSLNYPRQGIDSVVDYRLKVDIMNTLSIGTLAQRSGFGRETIRFYEREGLIPPPPRTPAGYRRYPPQSLARLRFIGRAKQLGFQLDEIRGLLALQSANGSRSEVKALTEAKLNQVHRKLDDLTRIATVLEHLAGACSGEGPVRGCPIIEALAGDRPMAAGERPAETHGE